jgi:hypothetical protein
VTAPGFLPGAWPVLDGDDEVVVEVGVEGDALCRACRKYLPWGATPARLRWPVGTCPHITHVRFMHTDPGITAVNAILNVIATDEVPGGLMFESYVQRVCTDARQIHTCLHAAAAAGRRWEGLNTIERERLAVELLDNRSRTT